MTAKQYLNLCRAAGVQTASKLERKECLFASAIYSSPRFSGDSVHTGISDKIQNITDEILQIDEEIKVLQNQRQRALKKMMLIEDTNVRQVLIKFYFDCRSYSQISSDIRISRSTVKRKLKRGILEFEKIFEKPLDNEPTLL